MDLSISNEHLFFDNKKNECKAPTCKIKKEFSEYCDEAEQKHSVQNPTVGVFDGIIPQDWSVKQEIFGDILMKEEIKEEDMEAEIPFPDQAEERLDSQQVNSANPTSILLVQNCLQEKIQCLPLNAEMSYSRPNSETPFLPGSGKLKNLCSTEIEQIGTHKHERAHTSEKPFKCSSCPHQAACKNNLKIHQRIHTGERPFKCHFCSYRATQPWNLKNHERTHTGKKPFKCNSCSYQSTRLDTIKRHENIHTGEKPFKCSSCPYQASQIGNLKEHKRTHTGEKPFKCKFCPYQAARKSYIRIHERTHTGERPFKCNSCSYQATQLVALKKHERTHTRRKLSNAALTPLRPRTLAIRIKYVTTHTGE